ncbi:MAG: NAD(P)-dependent oxidoreductase [Verrucomicrobiales bacterium]
MTKPLSVFPQALTFRIGLTGDFFKNGAPVYPDFDLGVFERTPGIAVSTFSEHAEEITPEQLDGLHGVIVLTPRVTRHSLSRSQGLLAISRFGVGYDSVDVAACTENDVVLCIAKGAVDRPMAEATVGWMLALAYRMRAKDRQMREGRWDQRGLIMGTGLHGRTVGVIGFGGIGRSVVDMLRGFGMGQPLVYDPGVDPETIAAAGANSVNLPYLMARSDFITVHCPLNAQTQNLISAPELDLMKPDAFLLNTARGGIVDEDALFDVLAAGRIAGAALDCSVGEPITQPHRFAELDNVILAPHNIGWTRELFRDIGAVACQNLIDLAKGQYPDAVVNPEVFGRPSFQKKWESMRIDQRPPQE